MRNANCYFPPAWRWNQTTIMGLTLRRKMLDALCFKSEAS